MIKLSKKIMSGALFLAIALVFYLMIPNEDTLTWYLPKFYSLVSIALSLGLILSGLIGFKKEDKDKIYLDKKNFKKSDQWKTVAFMAMLLVYFIIISYLGMVVSTVLFMVAMYLFLGVKNPKTIVISVIIMGAVYCAFAFGLHVQFPHGILY